MRTQSPSPKIPNRRARRAKPQPLELQLRQAIVAARKSEPSLTDYAIAKKIGVAQSVVGRFLNDGLSLSLETAGKLAEMFDLQLVKNSSK